MMMRFTVLSLTAVALVCGAAMVSPDPAHAVTTEEVVTLTKLGISPDEVIKAIEKDKTVFNLQVADILALKKAGVDEKVLKFMLSTPQRYGAKKGPGGTGGGTTGGTGGTTGGGTTGGGTAEPEMTPEEKAEQERRMREEAQRLLEEKQKAEEAARAAYAQGVLATGRKLAKQGKFVQAIQTFQKFVSDGNFPPESEEAYFAKYGIAEALVKAGLYQAAANQLVEVLLDGPDKPFFQLAFQQLRELRRRVNYSPPDLEELTKFFVGNFSKGFQCEYNYVLGEFYYDYNNWTQALKYLESVTPTCTDYGKAQYLKGLVEVRNQLAKSAVESFQRAIVATEENKSDPEVKDLAFLALARIAYEVGDSDAAIYYYRKVPRNSYKRATALYEGGWVYFMKGDASRALGTFHTLHSPYFDHRFYPELWILEATVYMNLCRYDYAELALGEFQKEIVPMMVPLKQFLLKTVRPEEYYTAVVNTVAGRETHGLPRKLVSAVLSNVEFYNLYKTIKQIEAEQKLVGENVGALGEYGADISKKLADLHADRVREIGIKIQRIFKELEATLAEYQIKLKEIEVDLQDRKLEEEQRRLEAMARGEKLEEKPVVEGETGGSTAIVGSDQWQWPFEGEYWADEIGYHRAFVASQCPVEEAQ